MRNMLSAGLLIAAICGLRSDARAVTLGDYTGHEVQPHGLVIHAGESGVVITPYTERVVRVSLRPHGEPGLDSSDVVVLNPIGFDWTVAVGETELTASGPRFVLHAELHPLRLRWGFDGRELVRDDSGFVWNGDARGVRLHASPTEHFYGAGERADGLDHRGRLLQGYNAPSYCYGEGAENLNIAIPLLLSSRDYALYFENSFPHTLDVGGTDFDVVEFGAQGGELSYFLMAGDSAPEVLGAYTELSGRQPLPPRWAMGYLQSRFGYQSEPEARALVNAFRAQRIPLDALILDLYWFGWGQMGDLDWDRSHWGNPVSMMADLAVMGVQTILIVEPYIVESSSNFAECYGAGYLTPDSAGTPVIMPQFWAGSAGLLDITLPAAQDWYWTFYGDRVNEGVGGWWSDLGEPELHPAHMVHAAGSAAQIHNVYSLRWAKLLFERYAEEFPATRLFNLIRSGYAGMQRYSAFPWSGDVQRSFSGMRAQLPILLSMGLSGVAFCGSDLGGFDCGPLDPELYIRWMQMGAFAPTMRAHGVNVPTEPVNFDSTTRRIVADFIRLRYRLLPYNYTLAWQNHATGMPLARPLFFDERTAETADLYDEYLWGPDLLVAPVTITGARARDVLLPPGRWINFWSDDSYAGGQTVPIAAPLEQMPVLVRAGSILPMAPVVQSTDDYDTDTLTVEYYPDPDVPSAEFTIYDDDGHTPNAYALNQYEHIRLRSAWNPVNFVLEFQRENHGFPGAPASRKMYCRLHRVSEPPVSVRLEGIELPVVEDSIQFSQADSAVLWSSPSRSLQLCFRWTGVQSDVEVEGLQILEVASRKQVTPEAARLVDTYPNPFNSMTTIRYELPGTQAVAICVYDLTGRRVAVLHEATESAGQHRMSWDARGLASGIYIVRLETSGSAGAMKTVLLK
ncbi:T9SS type A sorting domain-containing protein [candidate division KSB1 bacterium]|nr:T9SS type A sorting domain-containing protein [candidate division KSB1 bacterium]